jgi:hypothetical protein
MIHYLIPNEMILKSIDTHKYGGTVEDVLALLGEFDKKVVLTRLVQSLDSEPKVRTIVAVVDMSVLSTTLFRE